jgi:hypothetical protein
MRKDIVPQANGALTDPSAQRKGFEEPTDKEDLVIPRAKLLQALSPEVVAGENDPVSGDALRPGMIINSLTKQVLPGEIIPVFKFTNWIRFNPRNSKDANFNPDYGPGDIIWRTNDPLDLRVQEEGKFGANGEAPLATKFINFFCYFPGVNMPVILSFAKTSLKAGRRLLSLAQFSGRDMFTTKYKIASKQETGDAGTYFVLVVDQAGLASEEECRIGAQLWEQYSNKPIQVHEEEVTE